MDVRLSGKRGLVLISTGTRQVNDQGVGRVGPGFPGEVGDRQGYRSLFPTRSSEKERIPTRSRRRPGPSQHHTRLSIRLSTGTDTDRDGSIVRSHAHRPADTPTSTETPDDGPDGDGVTHPTRGRADLNGLGPPLALDVRRTTLHSPRHPRPPHPTCVSERRSDVGLDPWGETSGV